MNDASRTLPPSERAARPFAAQSHPVSTRSLTLATHRWLGIVAAFLLVIVALSGSSLVFERGIDRLLHPAVYDVTPGPATVPLQAMIQTAAAARPDDPVMGILRTDQPGLSYQVWYRSGLTAYVDPYTGRLLGIRNYQDSFARFLHVVHTSLVAGPTGTLVVGATSAATVLIVLSGVVLWWKRRILTITHTRTLHGFLFDWHHALGFYASIVILAMGVTGMAIAFGNVVDPLVERLNGTTPVVSLPRTVPVRTGAVITPDTALAIASRALPGAFADVLRLPGRPGDVYLAFLKFPEDRTPAGRSHVAIDPYTGRVLAIDNMRAAGWGTWLVDLKRSIHTGDLFGAPTEALYFIVGLIVAIQALSGFFMWWLPRRRRATAHREAAAADRQVVGS